jgi:hypothetical protein
MSRSAEHTFVRFTSFIRNIDMQGKANMNNDGMYVCWQSYVAILLSAMLIVTATTTVVS